LRTTGRDVLGDRVEVAEEVLDALAAELGVLLDGGVQVVDVRLVMAVVVDLHRLRVDVRLQRAELVGKRW